MKSSLRSQKEVVEKIADGPESIPGKVLILRRWLEEMGYENRALCTHEIVNRVRNRCHTCGVSLSTGF